MRQNITMLSSIEPFIFWFNLKQIFAQRLSSIVARLFSGKYNAFFAYTRQRRNPSFKSGNFSYREINELMCVFLRTKVFTALYNFIKHTRSIAIYPTVMSRREIISVSRADYDLWSIIMNTCHTTRDNHSQVTSLATITTNCGLNAGWPFPTWFEYEFRRIYIS